MLLSSESARRYKTRSRLPSAGQGGESRPRPPCRQRTSEVDGVASSRLAALRRGSCGARRGGRRGRQRRAGRPPCHRALARVEEVEAGGQAALVIYHPLSGRELRSLRHRYSVTRRTSASRTVACTISSPLPRMKHDRVARLPLLGCETNGSRTFGTRGVRLAARR